MHLLAVQPDPSDGATPLYVALHPESNEPCSCFRRLEIEREPGQPVRTAYGIFDDGSREPLRVIV